MKAKLLILAVALTAGFSNAATITVTAGLPAAGIYVTVDNADANYFFSVGQWDVGTSTWTAFGAPMSIMGELKGGIVGNSPTSLNNSIINLFVGTAATPQDCVNGSFVILTSSAGTRFPADVTTSAAVTFNASSSTTATILHNGNADNGFKAAGSQPAGSSSALNLAAIPETSTALLGALGALGLLRRRR